MKYWTNARIVRLAGRRDLDVSLHRSTYLAQSGLLACGGLLAGQHRRDHSKPCPKTSHLTHGRLSYGGLPFRT
jgi:hypothetical protein